MDAIVALCKISIIVLKHPISFIKQFSFLRIKIFLRAISHENPNQISQNLSYLLQQDFNDDISIKYEAFSKEEYHNRSQKQLIQFLKSDSRIRINATNPIISVILVLYNKANLSYTCLRSIEKYAQLPIQLLIVDNNSIDQTRDLLNRIDGAEITFNSQNIHFLKACNQLIDKIRTPYILFLNNDIELLNDSISTLYKTITANNKFGAVGGPSIGLDGKLLEAGSIVWNDGSCSGYGREQEPEQFNFKFNRIVDYCSGAFLLTRSDLFKKHGGFDELFMPAYYEETDYCLWLQKNGFKCIYNPDALVRHVEFGSSDRSDVIVLQNTNQIKFRKKHLENLQYHFENNNLNAINARFAASQKQIKKVLYIEDRIPHRDLGAGFTRSNEIVNTIQELGFQVTIFPMYLYFKESWTDAYKDLSPFIEIVKEGHYQTFSKFIKSRSEYYDIIWVSRPHNMDIIRQYLRKHAKNCTIIYDAEAIFSERMKSDLKLQKIPISKHTLRKQIKKETKLALNADIVLTVSVQDEKTFKSFGVEKTRILGHSLKIFNSKTNFSDRKDLLFIGNLDVDYSPNVDSIKWFINYIFPLVKKRLPAIKLNIIGSNKAESLEGLEVEGVIFHGKLNKLRKHYDHNRIFIAPTRYAAGIPYKVHEAAANGIPVVATQILGDQLAWNHKNEIILSSTNIEEFANKIVELYQNQKLWSQIQTNAYQFVEEHLDEESYEKQILNILNFQKS